MIEATRVETPRAASARFVPTRGPGLALPLDREEVAAAFRRPLQAIVPGVAPRRVRSRGRWPGPR